MAADVPAGGVFSGGGGTFQIEMIVVARLHVEDILLCGRFSCVLLGHLHNSRIQYLRAGMVSATRKMNVLLVLTSAVVMQ
jgi:hypothetical protein